SPTVSTCAVSCLALPLPPPSSYFFFFNHTATTEIYTLSLHDALPISAPSRSRLAPSGVRGPRGAGRFVRGTPERASRTRSREPRSEEHTSELQSLTNLVCRLLLEKKKKKRK